ncbi:MarR family winged helix-turn-helix transcriptional regulator [uncultured Brachyspira sp.]|uniref:MarR family winged helix-turn-helix transcriptional regulator n=1 Tax=uncultured Brachyspira sp. TaxID=221953 RepID=UPI0025EF7C22|nr:MarR family winged helix-turn-helix transcriptional regulator [uncultured Brachyspira sp.]
MNTNNSLKLVVILSKAHNAYIKKVKANIKSLGFSGSEFGALEYLYNKKSVVNVQELSEKILLTTATTAYTIDKLIKRGYISKKEGELDKRFVEISLTKTGKKVMQNIFPIHADFLEKLNPLTDEESEQLITLLKKLGKSNK